MLILCQAGGRRAEEDLLLVYPVLSYTVQSLRKAISNLLERLGDEFSTSFGGVPINHWPVGPGKDVYDELFCCFSRGNSDPPS